MKKHIDLFIEKEWMQDVKSSLKFLNIKVLSVGKIHHAWRYVPNDPRLVKRVLSQNTSFDGYLHFTGKLTSMRSIRAALFVAMGLRTVYIS